jgi:hypothetical protein
VSKMGDVLANDAADAGALKEERPEGGMTVTRGRSGGGRRRGERKRILPAEPARAMH